MTAIVDLYPSLRYGIESLTLEFLVEHRTASAVIPVEVTLCTHSVITTCLLNHCHWLVLSIKHETFAQSVNLLMLS